MCAYVCVLSNQLKNVACKTCSFTSNFFLFSLGAKAKQLPNYPFLQPNETGKKSFEFKIILTKFLLNHEFNSEMVKEQTNV